MKNQSKPIEQQSNKSQLSDQQVADYLLDNRDFFLKRDNLLMNLSLPHQSGNAVSLVERQVSVLRERNMEMRHRLNLLLDTARDNDKLLQKTQQLILELLDSRNLDEMESILNKGLLADPHTDACRLTLFENPDKLPDCTTRIVDKQEADAQIGSLLASGKPLCGVLRKTELTFLFPDCDKPVASAAIMPLSGKQIEGVLAIGSYDAKHFHQGMGSLFISFLGEVLVRILPRLTHANSDFAG
jgi:uncharacterized protein YigA (DUF484 family)